MTPAQAEAVRKAAERVAKAIHECARTCGRDGGAFVEASFHLGGLAHMPGSGALDHLIDAIEAPSGRTEASAVWRRRRDHVRAVDAKASPGIMRREWLPELATLAATQPDDETQLIETIERIM